MKLFRRTTAPTAAQQLIESFYGPFGHYPHPTPGAGVQRAREREARAGHASADPLTGPDRYGQHNLDVNTRQCRRARLRRDAKALLHEMKKHSKNPAAL